jgi:hypothetical protein
MNIDRYTKTLLTLITLSLLYLCARDLFRTSVVGAASPPNEIVKVVLVDDRGTPLTDSALTSGIYVGPVLHVSTRDGSSR